MIYMYYGNTEATHTSNGEHTFGFFDDFSGASLNLTKWAIEISGAYSVSDGILTMPSNDNTVLFGNSSTFAGDVAVMTSLLGQANSFGSHEILIADNVPANLVAFHGFNSPAPQIDFIVYEDSAWAADEDTSVTYAWNSDYHVYMITWEEDSRARLYQDGILISTLSVSEVPDGSPELFVVLATSGATSNEDVYYDWVLVRKFVDPEPSHGTWGTEKSGEELEKDPRYFRVDSSTPSITFEKKEGWMNSTQIIESDTALNITAQVVEEVNTLETVFICHNATGSFVNYTMVANGTADCFFELVHLSGLTTGQVFMWFFYANDSIGNWAILNNADANYSITVQAAEDKTQEEDDGGDGDNGGGDGDNGDGDTQIERMILELLTAFPNAVTQGTKVTVKLKLTDSSENGIEGAIVSLTIGNTSSIQFADLGEGIYTSTIDTSSMASSNYEITISASKRGYETVTNTFNLIIKKPFPMMMLVGAGGIVALIAIAGIFVAFRSFRFKVSETEEKKSKKESKHLSSPADWYIFVRYANTL